MAIVAEPVTQVAAVMGSYPGWWALAGGWSTDVWLGRVTREHHDVEVCCLRRESDALWEFIHGKGFELSVIDPLKSGWRAWERRTPIAAPAFQVQARGPALTFDVFLESTDGDDWVFRRDDRIVRPLAGVRWPSPVLPALRPDVQLLYMAKSSEPKNEADFRLVAPTLPPSARAWLRSALDLAHPAHRWLEAL